MSQDRLLQLARRFAELAPAQRQVFLKRLAEQNIDFSLLPIPPRADAAAVLPASYAQARLWLLWRLEPDSPAYNMAGRLKLSGALNEAALLSSLNALAARHEALRTTFTAGPEGEALQQVQPPAPLHIRRLDLSGQPDAQVHSLAEAEALRPFDLASGPLWRVVLLRRGPQEHLLLLTVHHIVSDGWSAHCMLAELAQGYAAACSGRPAALAPLPIQYPDFARWQRHWLEAGEGARQLAWWRQTLGDAHPVLALPEDRPRPATPSQAGARHRFEMPASVVAQLRAVAQAQGATLFMALLAGFKAVLHRYSGAEDLRVGVPAAGRNRAETEGLIGFFINTLVLRTRPSGGQLFAALLAEVKQAVLGAQAHQDLPFEQLVEALGGERSASHHPLFQVMANHQSYGETPQWPGLRVEEVSQGNPVAKFDLTLSTEEHADGRLDCTLVYASELFDSATVERLAGHLCELLAHAAQSPDTRLDQLRLLAPAELAQTQAWNAPALASLPAFIPLPQALSAQAQAFGSRTALIQGDTVVSWQALESRANRLAHRLIAHGVGAEVRVGVGIERSPEMVIALLAILKAGGAFVPLDPGYPADRLAYMRADAGIQHLLTQRHLAAQWAELAGQNGLQSLDILYVEDPNREWSSTAPQVAIHPAQSAYLIYTSGSTGQPKGVCVEHGPLARHCQAIGQRYRMEPQDTVLHFASINFDLAHEYWLMPLLYGARLVITDTELWSPAQACAQMARHGVTVAAFPPSYLVQLAEAALARAQNENAEAAQPALALRVLAFGGEALSREHFELVRRAFAPATLINGYGPTETVISPLLWTTTPDSDPARWQHSPYLPIGTPVGARSAWVLDAALNPLPVGVAGELYLGGPELARAYHRRPGLTAERFVPDPWNPGARLYRTGDRARWHSDGSVDYLGRLDQQVKLRGLRIELGEIEAQLLACAGVREAAVVVYGEGAQAQLLGYWVAQEGAQAPDEQALRQQLARQLPGYMVPARLMRLEALPVTANGKLDRRALPAPQQQTEEEGAGSEHEAPRTASEIALAAIWAEVLGRERVGLQAHFFALGGHSLLATQVCARIQRHMGLAVPLKILFQAPVLGDFAQRVDSKCRSAVQSPIPRRAPDASVPLSHAQQGLWFLWRSQPDDAGYNIYSALRFTGVLQQAFLSSSLDALAARHVALRSSFRADRDGRLTQTIHPPASVALAVVDLSDWPAATREPEARRLAEAESLHPFDLEHGPLLRARLLRLGTEEHVLLLTIHHIVADGWSMGLIFDELMALYRAQVQGLAATLPPLVIDHADYCAWQQQAGDHAVDLAYWRAQLDGWRSLALPAPADAPAQPSLRGKQLLFTLDTALVGQARSLAQGSGVSLSMLLQTAFHALLYRHSGQADHCIGILASNRDRVETEALVGLFLNAQPVRARIDPAQSFAALLLAVKDSLLGAQAHAGLPFTQLVQALRVARVPGRNPLFQVLYNYLRPNVESLQTLPGLAIDDFPVPRRTVVLDLELDVAEDTNGQVRGAFSYAVERVDAAFVQALWTDYPRLLAGLVEAPQQALAASLGPVDTPRAVRRQQPAAALPPHAELEAALTPIVTEILGLAHLDRQDNFFALGAGSLHCLQVQAKAHQQGVALRLADLFTYQTMAELASAVGQRSSASSLAMA